MQCSITYTLEATGTRNLSYSNQKRPSYLWTLLILPCWESKGSLSFTTSAYLVIAPIKHENQYGRLYDEMPRICTKYGKSNVASVYLAKR
jgi:hypothetical protein